MVIRVLVLADDVVIEDSTSVAEELEQHDQAEDAKAGGGERYVVVVVPSTGKKA